MKKKMKQKKNKWKTGRKPSEIKHIEFLFVVFLYYQLGL